MKVFCVGFHKTGTKSLAWALDYLGYSVTGPNYVNSPPVNETTLNKVFDLIPNYDAFQDNPWPVLFKEIDERFPGNRFILTIREAQKWINSVVKYFGNKSTPMREWIYGAGSPLGNESLYLQRYMEHNECVIDYFSGRKDLLIMNLEEGDGWELLANFLGVESPEIPFPHLNIS